MDIIIYKIVEKNKICVDEVFESLSKEDKNCPCRVDCRKTEYDVTLSSSNWPSQFYQVCLIFISKYGKILKFIILKRYNNNHFNIFPISQNKARKKYGTKNQDLDEFKNNFAQISVYFKSLNTKFITEQPKYSVSESIST